MYQTEIGIGYRLSVMKMRDGDKVREIRQGDYSIAFHVRVIVRAVRLRIYAHPKNHKPYRMISLHALCLEYAEEARFGDDSGAAQRAFARACHDEIRAPSAHRHMPAYKK